MLPNLSTSVLFFVFSIFSLWLGILSFLTWRLQSHYNHLLSNAGGKDLKSVLENILTQLTNFQKELNKLTSHGQKIEKEGKSHLQKFSLLRFNPFGDTGGDQSFVLTLLDGQQNGIVVSSLHSRTGTRWYAKAVKNGKGHDYDLSTEEQKAIKMAEAQSLN